MKKFFLIFLGLMVLGLYGYMFWSKNVQPQGSETKKQVTLEKDIVVESPRSGEIVSSPLSITGKARGSWYFEASFPIIILDKNRNQIATGHATAIGDWMTVDFVPFSATLVFPKPTSKTGIIVLKNDNPSGEPERSKSIEIPISFSQ